MIFGWRYDVKCSTQPQAYGVILLGCGQIFLAHRPVRGCAPGDQLLDVDGAGVIWSTSLQQIPIHRLDQPAQ